ncbi:class I SAM-dependent methyltransferase [Candidatus Woesearchaeota archaeon]|nr:MAG: class I SAM-dependent methyltransferase [Candidatus Woesearchaeota archaeon]
MSHETATEHFYSHGVENYGTFHDNYLNFGLWENNITDFVLAAEHLLSRVGTKIGLGTTSELLDVACGMGTQDRYFLKTFGPKRIEAIDLTKKHIELAQSRNPSKRITYRVGNAVSLPFADETFTHVTAIEGEVHFNTREKFFREAFRVLKPGGKIGLSDFCLARLPKNAFERAFVKLCAKIWHIPLANIDSPDSYRAKLMRNGYINVDVERVGPNVIPGYYYEQARPEVRRELARIRGFYAGRIGFFIDWFMFQLYKRGLLEYILVSGQKP